VKGDSDRRHLPLGRKIEFETDFFKGYYYFRLRNIKPKDDDAKGHESYFQGKKRFYQLVVQGRFKDCMNNLTFADLFTGDVYEKPLEGLPRGVFYRAFKRFMESLEHGLVFDAGAEKPKVLAPIGGCQTLRVDLPGQEPSDFEHLVEDTALLGSFGSVKERKKALSKPETARGYKIDPNYVYTAEVYDHTTDYATFNQYLGGKVKVDLVPSLAGQNLSLGWYRYDRVGDKVQNIFNFPILHERALAVQEH